MELVECVNYSPHSFRLFTYAAVNVTSTSKEHWDNKDYKWCCIIPLGDFEGGAIRFPELKVDIHVKQGDLLIFKSRKLLHKALPALGKKSSIVLTNHRSVLRKMLTTNKINNC